jgi:hypothetical protein
VGDEWHVQLQGRFRNPRIRERDRPTLLLTAALDPRPRTSGCLRVFGKAGQEYAAPWQDTPHFRLETFNLFNHPLFSFPQLAPTNSAFGLIAAQSNKSRSVQLTGRIVF